MQQNLFEEQMDTLLTVTKHKDYTPQEIEALAHIYFRNLKNIPDAIWLRTVEEILLTEEFFPTIHKLNTTALKLAREEDMPPKMEAWSQVITYIKCGGNNGRLAHSINPFISATVDIVGGWERIGYAKIGYELDHIRNEFFNCYDNLIEEREQTRFPADKQQQINRKTRVRLVQSN